MSARRPAPWHLWPVGAASLAISAFGVFDLAMSHFGGQGYQQRMNIAPEQLSVLRALPAWLDIVLAGGSGASLLASVFLLLRMRACTGLFAVAVAASLTGLAAIFGSPAGWAAFGPAMLLVGLLSLAVQMALFGYTRHLGRRGDFG